MKITMKQIKKNELNKKNFTAYILKYMYIHIYKYITNIKHVKES